LITVRNLFFRIVEWPEFHVFCRVLNSEIDGYIIIAHSEIGKIIQNLWILQKDVVRKKLQLAILSIYLSLNIWTSPNRYFLFGICAYFVERNPDKFSNAFLAFRTVLSHNRED
jgi:hypothetical protein